MRRALPIVLALAAAAAVALAANLLLLGYATNRNDPVGKLSPRAAVITTPSAPPALRTGTVRIVTTPPHHADDHGGDD
jgi:hypothetical protein